MRPAPCRRGCKVEVGDDDGVPVVLTLLTPSPPHPVPYLISTIICDTLSPDGLVKRVKDPCHLLITNRSPRVKIAKCRLAFKKSAGIAEHGAARGEEGLWASAGGGTPTPTYRVHV